MATIASLAREFDMQPYELRALADLHSVVDDETALDDETEAFVRDLVTKTDADGVYRG